MKYLVELKYTNPSHEHVSLRRKVHSVNRIVEASNPEEAVFRATRQQRALGFMVSEAKVVDEQKPQTSTAETAEVLSEEVKKANFRIRSDDRDGNTHYITRTDGRMSSHNERGRMTALSNHAFRHPGGTEGAERAVRGALHKATNSEDAAARMNASGLGYSNWKPEAHDEDPSSWKYTNEEVEQIDEAPADDHDTVLYRLVNKHGTEKEKQRTRLAKKRYEDGTDSHTDDTHMNRMTHKYGNNGKQFHDVRVDTSNIHIPKNLSKLANKHGGEYHARDNASNSWYRFREKEHADAFKHSVNNHQYQRVSPSRRALSIGAAQTERMLGEDVERVDIDEKAPPGAKYERMVKHIKAKYAAGGLTDAEKRKAYGAAWNAYNAQKMEEDVEQVEEASEKEAPYLAQFVPNADAPMRDHLAFPVHTTSEDDAHRAFERTFGKKMKADYTLHGIFPADVNEEVEQVDEETPPARVIAAQKKFDLEAKANARNTEQAGSAAADRRAEIIRKAKEELAKRKSLAEAKKPDDKEKKIVVGGKGANKEKVSVTPSISDDNPDRKPGTERN